MFLEIFFLCEETVLGYDSQNMSRLRQINGVTRELNVHTPSADFHLSSPTWLFALSLVLRPYGWPFRPCIWYFEHVHPFNFLSAFEAFCHQNLEGRFFSAFGQNPPPTFGLGSTFRHPLAIAAQWWLKKIYHNDVAIAK